MLYIFNCGIHHCLFVQLCFVIFYYFIFLIWVIIFWNKIFKLKCAWTISARLSFLLILVIYIIKKRFVLKPTRAMLTSYLCSMKGGKAGAVLCCWSYDFGVWKMKKKMTSGRLVSLPHLHEKQESDPLAVALIHLFVLPALPY